MKITATHNDVNIIIEFLENGVHDLIMNKVQFEYRDNAVEKYLEEFLIDVYEDLLGKPLDQSVISRIIAKALVERRILPSICMFSDEYNPIVNSLHTGKPYSQHLIISIDHDVLNNNIEFDYDKVPMEKSYSMSYEELLDVSPRSTYLDLEFRKRD